MDVMAEWFRTSNSSFGGQVIGVWVRIPVLTLVSLSKMLIEVLVEVDIVYEKAF